MGSGAKKTCVNTNIIMLARKYLVCNLHYTYAKRTRTWYAIYILYTTKSLNVTRYLCSDERWTRAISLEKKTERWRERLDLLISPSRGAYMYTYECVTHVREHSTLDRNVRKYAYTYMRMYMYVYARIATSTYRRDNRRGRADALVSEYLGCLPLSPSRRRESQALITLTKFSHFPLNVPFVLMNDLSSYLLSPCARSPESSFRGVGLAR